MGTRFEDGFPEIWDNIKPVFDGAVATKKAVDVVEIPLTVERNGFVEETFFTGNFNPLREDTGAVAGFYNALTEVTRQKLNDRRIEMLNLACALTEEHTNETLSTHIINSLRTNTVDIPFALLYSNDDESTNRLTLRGSIGLPDGHKLAIQHASLDSDEGLFPLLRSTTSSAPITVPTGIEFDGVEWAGYGEPSKHMAAVKLANAGRSHGYLIVGTNPRRPIDGDHYQFMRDIASRLSATIASTVNMEESRKRQYSLESKLAISEHYIRYMAKHLDIGLEHVDLDGKVIWANEHYYTLVGRNPDYTTLPFGCEVVDEDQPKIHQAWKDILVGAKITTLELRTNRQWIPPSGSSVPATVLLSAFPYTEDGKVKSIMACMTDVSRLKWAESWHALAAQEAQEAKRQQSEFTDAISHEVRNPLSAILQLADGIMSSSEECQSQHSDNSDDRIQTLRDNAEAARTILLCANHQRRIVDDVLNLSKMDFMLMTLTPTAIQLSDLVDDALKMLEAELTSGHINLHVYPDDSLRRLGVSEVLCDPLRINQIVINLVSNAIKLTKREMRRDITLTYGASLSNPRDSFPQDITWAKPKQQQPTDLMLGEEWGSSQQVYLNFTINDSGPGMTEEELSRLFNRFEQASPRTSIKYGGSGLGLFISHGLAEKQSGSIGVSSKVGQGSTFAFYIRARRLETPQTPPMESVFLEFEQSLVEQRLDEQDVVEPSAIEQSLVEQVVAMPTLSESSLLEQNIGKAAALCISMDQAQKKEHVDALYHVLLVEDNIVNAKILRKQLEKARCVVHVANHGVEALDLLQSMDCWRGSNDKAHQLDIVLMDWEMPIMDGLTCCKEIRSLQRSGQVTRHLEIIAVTANVRQEQVDRAFAAGMDQVVAKPFVIKDLLKTIKERLGR